MSRLRLRDRFARRRPAPPAPEPVSMRQYAVDALRQPGHAEESDLCTGVRFAEAADGTRIGWRRFGDPAPTALVLTNGFATSSFYWDETVRHFARVLPVVTWDLKGHGTSSPARDLSRCTVADSVDDLRRVLDAAEVEHAVLAGFSMGCQIVLEAWRHIPDRIAAIAAVLGTYERPFDSLLHPAFGAFAAQAMRRVGPWLASSGLRLTSAMGRTRVGHRLNQATGMIGPGVDRERMRPFNEHLVTIDSRTWVAMGVAAQEHSAADVLPTIEVPALVVSGGRDKMTPPRCSRRMVEAIPDVTHVHLPEATHAGLYEEAALIGAALEALIERTGAYIFSASSTRSSRDS